MLRKIGRIILKTVFWCLIVLIVLLLVLDRFIQFRMDDKELTEYFSARHVPERVQYYQAKGRQIRYVATGDGDTTKATILFIHGAPSSASYWKGYLSDSLLLAKANMYAVDRPGYGYSGLADPLPSIADQSAAIKPILDSLNKIHRPVVVVGVSYGGPIACRLVMDNPGMADGLVLLAPPIAPGRERYFWFTYLVENPLIHWVVPRMLQTANREKVNHRAGLEAMLPLWPSIHIPVSYLQGADDGLVYTDNAAFAKKELVNSPSVDFRFFPGRGHLIAFNQHPEIADAILKMIDKCKTAPH